MSTKIAGTVHLTRGQWRILAHLMQRLADTDDDSVRRVAEILLKVARESS